MLLFLFGLGPAVLALPGLASLAYALFSVFRSRYVEGTLEHSIGPANKQAFISKLTGVAPGA